MLFYEIYFGESNFNEKLLIWSHEMIITKYEKKKKMGEFYFGQSVRKLAENFGKVLFYETYFEEKNFNRKQVSWSHYKITTKF